MKILIVDDELVSRKKMERILQGGGEIHSAEGGVEALGLFKGALDAEAPFQLILLDISMPDMDGTEVLLEVREYEEARAIAEQDRVKVLMVTSQSDKNSVVTCIQAGCQGYIVKPFDREMVRAKVAQIGVVLANQETATDPAGGWDAAVADLVADFRDGNAPLPVFPTIVREIETLLEDPQTNADDLAEVIERDVVLSGRIIAIANSPLCRGTTKVRTVAKAIPRLGLKGTQSVVSALASRNFYASASADLRTKLDTLWQHSLVTAYAGRFIAEGLRMRDVERLFLMGMLHDIGKVILLNGLGTLISDDSPAAIQTILNTVHRHHNEFGAIVLKLWDLPAEFSDAARDHEDQDYHPLTAQTTLVTNLANNIAREAGHSLSPIRNCDLGTLPAAQLLKVDPEMILQVQERLQEQLSSGDGGLMAA